MKKSEKPTLSEVVFETPTFAYIEKTKDWYWILWILGLAVAGAAFVLGNYSFGALIILSSFVLSLLATKRPETITVAFTNTHVHVGSKKWKINEFTAYNFIPEEHRVLLKHEKPYIPIVVIPIGPRPPEGKIRHYLVESAWEEDDEIREPFIEILMERIGF